MLHDATNTPHCRSDTTRFTLTNTHTHTHTNLGATLRHDDGVAEKCWCCRRRRRRCNRRKQTRERHWRRLPPRGGSRRVWPASRTPVGAGKAAADTQLPLQCTSRSGPSQPIAGRRGPAAYVQSKREQRCGHSRLLQEHGRAIFSRFLCCCANFVAPHPNASSFLKLSSCPDSVST